MRVLSAEEMRQLDKRTIEEAGIAGLVLMENAGRGAAELFHRHFHPLFPGPVLVLAGKGNNGGDGYVIARHLLNRGWQVHTLVLAERESVSGDARTNLEILQNIGARIAFAPDDEQLRKHLEVPAPLRVAVDALFGTGLSSAVRGHYAFAIDWLNEIEAPVFAVDIPSGLCATSGRILGRSVRAEVTATFAYPKTGQLIFPGAACVGRLESVDIGVPAMLAEQEPIRQRWIDAEEALGYLPPRPATGHKGTFGHLLVIGGSTGKSGAVSMTAEGGMRAGAGLVTVGCPAGINPALEVKLTEVMSAPLSDVDGALSQHGFEDIMALLEGKDALALGPGLGMHPETSALVRRLVRECRQPLVLDADGLNAVAEHPEVLLEREPGSAVLTPHPGEMARLCNMNISDIENDRVAAARRFAEKYRVVLVLKGARTLVALPEGEVRINSSGNPGMASGGMGDILTGMVGGYLAQGAGTEAAATLAVYLHGCAGDRLSVQLGEAGMVATDLLREIPAARRHLLHQGAADA